MQHFKAVRTDDPGREIFKKTSNRKVSAMKRSLCLFITSLQGHEVSVELNNDTKVFGVLENCDRSMNLVLLDATTSALHGSEGTSEVPISTKEPSSYISGRSIRYILFSPSLKAGAHLSQHLKRLEYLSGTGRPHEIKDRKRKADEDES